MRAQIKSVIGEELVMEVKVKLSDSMLAGEECIQQALNEAGQLATDVLLKHFDTDGTPIAVGALKLTSKGRVSKKYQTPYGEVEVPRHVYQGTQGGSTYCPLDKDARIIHSATPKFAKQLSHKYSKLSVDEVKTDLESNHGRKLSRGYIQSVSEAVGTIAQAKEEHWSYSTPKQSKAVNAVSIGLDGTCMYLRDDGFREAMVGTVALYDKQGERLHTTYIAAPPEYGKAQFMARLEREIAHVKQDYPKALYLGVADGAQDNWSFLKRHTTIQVTDFWHATEYLASASEAIFPKRKEAERQNWLEECCHKLKHVQGAASRILTELKGCATKKLSEEKAGKLNKTITYFTNQKPRMKYSAQVARKLPIGSGVTEAACKTIIKQRLCRSGMKWKDRGASIVLSLRCLDRSNRWEEFWDKISQYGVAFA